MSLEAWSQAFNRECFNYQSYNYACLQTCRNPSITNALTQVSLKLHFRAIQESLTKSYSFNYESFNPSILQLYRFISLEVYQFKCVPV